MNAKSRLGWMLRNKWDFSECFRIQCIQRKERDIGLEERERNHKFINFLLSEDQLQWLLVTFCDK